MASNNGSNSVNNIYSEYIHGLNESMNKDAFFNYFLRCLQSGKNNMGVTQKKVERKLEGKWLDMIEDTVIPLDNIIRNPRRYIKNIEEIEPIELARGITEESIQHLAQHTDMIAKIDDDGMVTPERILNITKEESFDTYENRFVYTLLNNLDYFITRCLNSINDGGKDITELTLTGESMIGKEKVKYHLFFSCEGQGYTEASNHYELLHTDISKLSVLQRVERVRKILYNFRESFLIKELKNCAPVRPPLHMTNVLLKNPDFVKAVELWNFISNYRGEDVEITSTESIVDPEQGLISDVFSLIPLQYTIIKNNLGGEIEVPTRAQTAPPKKKIKVSPLKEQIEVFVDSLDVDIQEIRKIFVDAIDKKEKERMLERKRVDHVITHILGLEQAWLDEENERLRLKQEAKEEAARLEFTQNQLFPEEYFAPEVEEIEEDEITPEPLEFNDFIKIEETLNVEEVVASGSTLKVNESIKVEIGVNQGASVADNDVIVAEEIPEIAEAVETVEEAEAIEEAQAPETVEEPEEKKTEEQTTSVDSDDTREEK